MYSRPLMQLRSVPPPGMGDLKDMPMHNIIQRLDSFAMSNIVEVNTDSQDHPPNPPPPSDDNEADIKPSQSRTTIGRLGEYGHDLRPIQILPFSLPRPIRNSRPQEGTPRSCAGLTALHFEEGGLVASSCLDAAPARSIREEEDDTERVGVGAASRARKAKEPTKKKVSFLQGARLDSDGCVTNLSNDLDSTSSLVRPFEKEPTDHSAFPSA
ncbi:hypothetical protein A4X13_0g8522 [Tilletia indica]|uniref:Uncharacterized protein n=1 Tax=Tilletia indica TaxID=43049 RepID=A0A177T2Y6_9BASI|nr:hypothetical protein A4X13_0g8522 [Tilletia indica]